jgi:hypothetical protein
MLISVSAPCKALSGYHEFSREGRDQLPGGVQTVVDASSTLEDTVKRIMRETGLDKVAAIDR